MDKVHELEGLCQERRKSNLENIDGRMTTQKTHLGIDMVAMRKRKQGGKSPEEYRESDRHISQGQETRHWYDQSL